MSSSATFAPALGAAERIRSAVVRTLAGELIGAAVVAGVVIVLLFGSHILHGGLQSDDWALLAVEKFPKAFGFSNSWSGLAGSAGSRIGAVVYWIAIYSLFGLHAKVDLAIAAVFTLAMAVSFYFILRVARFSTLESGAMMLIAIVLPVVGVTRFWATTAGGQICFVFYFLGLAAALRAFEERPGRRLRWHLISLGLYALSAAYAEVAMPLVAVSALIYMTRAPFVRSVKRAIPDLIIVAGCYAGTIEFVSGTDPGLGSSHWFAHFKMIYSDALTILSATVVPFGNGSHALILVLVAVLLVASVVLWRRPATAAATRRELRRWGVTFGICVAGAFAGWFTYVPSTWAYRPLEPGNTAHINIVVDAPLAAGTFALIMVARAIVLELLSSSRLGRGRNAPRAARAALVLALAWFAYVAVDGALDVRHNASIWTSAQTQEYNVLSVIKDALPQLPRNSTVVTFAEPATVAPGMPVFVLPWELTDAIKDVYNRPDINAYPILQDLSSVECGPHNMLAVEEGAPMGPAFDYGHAFFVDIATRQASFIANQAACQAIAATYPAGPYDLGPVNWSL
jgi:hypothetical protein